MSSPSAIWRHSKNTSRLLGEKGKIVTYSVVRTAPTGFEALAPYVVAVVELEGGKRLTAQIVDWEGKKIKIGARVEAVFRKLYEPDPAGVIHYGIKFRLVDEKTDGGRRKTEFEDGGRKG